MSPLPGSSQSELLSFFLVDAKIPPSVSSDLLHSSIFLLDGQLIERKEHLQCVSLPQPLYLSRYVAYLGVAKFKPYQHIHTIAWGTITTGRKDVSVCWANVRPSWNGRTLEDTLENSGGQCECSLKDSHPLHILLWTCSTSAPQSWCAWGWGWRKGPGSYTFGSIFPSCFTSLMSGASSAQQYLWFHQTKALAAAASMYGLALWARSLGLNHFLIRSTSYLSSWAAIPSWAHFRFAFPIHQFPTSIL